VVEAKPKLLIVEDDLDVADMLNAYFRVQGYEVFTVNWGEDGVRDCLSYHPDLLILDIRLPDIDGYEVARRVRSNHRTADIPIIFLTEKRERNDRLQGMELGADDYITKPFDVQELRLRVRNVLRRAGQGSLTNPVTGLPEGTLVNERLSECIDKPAWTLLIVGLENLDIFREAYGFVASDDALRAVSLMILNALREINNPEDFLGHLGQTEFVLVIGAERVKELENRIRSRLEQSLDYFYPIKDREQKLSNGKRLGFKMGVLRSEDGEISSLDSLKLALVRSKA
jgi:PleD family two-component response regulator